MILRVLCPHSHSFMSFTHTYPPTHPLTMSLPPGVLTGLPLSLSLLCFQSISLSKKAMFTNESASASP